MQCPWHAIEVTQSSVDGHRGFIPVHGCNTPWGIELMGFLQYQVILCHVVSPRNSWCTLLFWSCVGIFSGTGFICDLVLRSHFGSSGPCLGSFCILLRLHGTRFVPALAPTRIVFTPALPSLFVGRCLGGHGDGCQALHLWTSRPACAAMVRRLRSR